MREDNKNLLLAIALSVVVLIGWQYFFAPPTPPRPPAQPPVAQQTAPPPSPSQAGGPAAPLPGTAVPAPGAPGQAVEPRETALARAPRVAIDTPAIQGSVNLRGGRIDDVRLKHYRETVDPRSPNIVLLSPSGSQNPYYAEFGWVGAAAGALPAPDTVWTADARTLTPGQNTTGKVWDGNVGGFVGITDKYWAAAVIPDQAQPFQGSFTSRQDANGRTYQANMLGDARALPPGGSIEV